MRKILLSAALSAGLLLGTAGSGGAMQNQTTQTRTTRTRTTAHTRTTKNNYVHRQKPTQNTAHKRHMKTAKRVGVGAAGGAVVGGLVGGGKGAAVGAAAGAGGGALYDRHEKKKGQY